MGGKCHAPAPSRRSVKKRPLDAETRSRNGMGHPLLDTHPVTGGESRDNRGCNTFVAGATIRPLSSGYRCPRLHTAVIYNDYVAIESYRPAPLCSLIISGKDYARNSMAVGTSPTMPHVRCGGNSPWRRTPRLLKKRSGRLVLSAIRILATSRIFGRATLSRFQPDLFPLWISDPMGCGHRGGC